MVSEIHLDDKLLIREKRFEPSEAKEERNKRDNLIGVFHKYWEIFTWNSEGRFKLINKEGKCGYSRIEISVSDISAGCASDEYFSSVNLTHPIHSIRVHSYSIHDTSPTIFVSQNSMMMVVQELERVEIPCLLHHMPRQDFVGWKNAVDYVSESLREKIGDNYVSSELSWVEKGLCRYPVEL